MLKKEICYISVLFVFFLLAPMGQGLSVSAHSAAVIDVQTGTTLFEKDADVRMGMASTTKIMTAICAIEEGNLDDIVEITEEMTNIEGSSIYLKVGERFTLEELLYGLMLHSGNDAAIAVAVHVAGTVPDFVNQMNGLAQKIGMLDTSFENPNGLNENNHYTTANDLAKLAAYACKNETFSQIVSVKTKTIGHLEGTTARYLTNHNKMLRIYEGADGIKTGYTKKAGRCLVTSATRDNMRLVCVTLNAPDDWRDHKTLLDECFSQFTLMKMLEPYSVRRTIPVTGGVKQAVPVVNIEGVLQIFDTTSSDIIAYKINAPHFLYAPIQKGAQAGTVQILKNGMEIAKVPLIYSESVEAVENPKGLIAIIADFFQNILLKLFR